MTFFTQKKLISLVSSLILLAIFVWQPQLFQKFEPQASPIPVENPAILGAKNPEQITVKRIIDGDTIELQNGQKIRYIGIDTPETKHPKKGVKCFGKEASAKNKELIEGKTLQLEKDVSETDRYGRLLRCVFVDGILINELLVKEGYARASSYPPDIKYQERFRLAEQDARENARGLWGSNCQ